MNKRPNFPLFHQSIFGALFKQNDLVVKRRLYCYKTAVARCKLNKEKEACINFSQLTSMYGQSSGSQREYSLNAFFQR